MSNTFHSIARGFGSIRDKGRNGVGPRNIDTPLFSLDENRKRLNKDELQKLQDIKHAFALLGRNNVPDSRIEYALRSKAAQGDVEAAMAMLLLYEDSLAGVLHPFKSDVKMLGAENREKTTCWLDSLLFAMFARTDVFEAVLHQDYVDDERRRLVHVLRLWVNMLRSGRLITTDITQHLQAAVADCGWPDAAKLRQQDVSEAFNFITDKLQLPLLTLKTDIYHQGKEDANDDHKFITERMLDVALPDDLPAGQSSTLEVLLEDYFNNRVEVKRHLARVGTVDHESNSDPMEKSNSAHVEATEVLETPTSIKEMELPDVAASNDSPAQRPSVKRLRATSIFSERRVNINQAGSDAKEAEAKANGASKKEVLMPAWQFLNLIPWYTANAPEGSNQGRSPFSDKNLMLGICIKRYGMTKEGSPFRRNTHVDIPLEMASPHFTAGDDVDMAGVDVQNFKLVLVAFICHRGNSVDAGHYISIVRTAFQPQTDPPQGCPADSWLRFDDLATDRVAPVDVNRALRSESPYILFYKVQPIGQDGFDDTPPPYEDPDGSMDVLAEKLALLKKDQSQTSFETAGRRSLDATKAIDSSPHLLDSRGRLSMNESRRRSILAPSESASARATAIDLLACATGNGSTVSTRAASPSISRQRTKSNRASKERLASDDSSARRFSASIARFRIGRDREKNTDTEVLVDEIPQPLPPVPALSASAAPDSLPSKVKDKKRKSKWHGAVAEVSARQSKANKPDRDCSMM